MPNDLTIHFFENVVIARYDGRIVIIVENRNENTYFGASTRDIFSDQYLIALLFAIFHIPFKKLQTI